MAAVMKRTRLLILLMATFLVGGMLVPLAQAALAADTGIASIIYRYAAGRVSQIEVYYEDGVYQEFQPVSVTQQPTATATLSATPTSTPSATPMVTPWPTFTPTNTPGWSPTPTQEATPQPTVPPATPQPTPEEVCYGTVLTDGLRLRATPSTSGAVIGAWPRGQRLRVLEVEYAGADEWARVRGPNEATGWSAAWYQGEAYIQYDSTPECATVRFPEPAARTIRAGPHILMGEGASVVEQYAAGISAAKCLPGSYQICQKLKQANPAIWTIARPLTDHLATDYGFNPLRAWDAVKGMIPAGFDALELENESTPPDDRIALWVQFSIGMAELVAHDTGMQYLCCSFGPGNPPADVWPQLLPYLEWVATHPLPDGRYHGLAIHASPYATFNRPDMPWVNNLYLAGRIYWERDLLFQETGFDLATWPGVIAVTELGLSDGYSGSWDAPYNCQEAADAYRTTQTVYRTVGYPQVLIWWNFGKIGLWTSDSDCAAALFG
jgi:hypothetical protein